MSKKYNNFPGGLKIISEYFEYLPHISNKGFNQLKDNIKQDGEIRNPIVIDENGVILDGHARYKIAEMLDMGFKTVVQKVDSIEEGQLWMMRNDFGRRPLSVPVLKKLDDLAAEITGVKSKTVKTPTSHLDKLIATGTTDEVVEELIKVFGDDIARIAEYLRNLLPGKETAAMVVLVCKSLEKA